MPGVCGDGVRALLPVREACDDGNADEADACTSGCDAQVFLVESTADGIDFPPGPRAAVGVDGVGDVLYVWTAALTRGAGAEVRARRFSASGGRVDVGPSITLAAGLGVGVDPHPTVVGLAAGGWVVAWEERGIDSSDLGIAYRVVRADGSLRTTARGNQTTLLRQHQPVLAATATGFVLGWTDESGFSSGAASRIVLRAFTASGPSGAEVVVSGSDDASDPAIALTAASGMLGYVAIGSVSGLRTVRAVRLDGTAPMGSAVALDVTTSDTHSVALAALSDGSFAATWVSRERDGLGDVRARGIAADGTLGPITIDTRAVSPDPEVAETEPSIAALPAGAYLVSYAIGREDAGAAAVAVGVRPPELSPLQEALSASSTGDVSLVPGPDGVWVSFGLAERAPVMGALRAVYGFHLAGD